MTGPRRPRAARRATRAEKATERGRFREKRKRRTAEEAHAEILDAAEARLSDAGPEALRLKDVARDVGVSHPAVLHHFGSRAELVKAVVVRSMLRLRDQLITALSQAEESEASAAEVLALALAGLRQGGHARLVAWLALCNVDADIDEAPPPMIDLALAMHARRLAASTSDPPPSLEDTLFMVRLATLALFGEAIVGDKLQLGVDDSGREASSARFRNWLGKLMLERLA